MTYSKRVCEKKVNLFQMMFRKEVVHIVMIDRVLAFQPGLSALAAPAQLAAKDPGNEEVESCMVGMGSAEKRAPVVLDTKAGISKLCVWDTFCDNKFMRDPLITSEHNSYFRVQ